MSDVTGQKRKLSKLCLTGFILSVLSPILLVINTCINWEFADWDLYYMISAIALVVAAILPVVGLILSIAGVVTASIKRKRGKGFGVAGIVLPNLYVAFIIVFVCLFGFLMIQGTRETRLKEQQSDLNSMGGVRAPVNTEYDVSQYRIFGVNDIYSPDITVSDTALLSYAGSKLETINKESEKSIKGKYQNYDFLIIRSDLFDEWYKDDRLGNINYSEEGYATMTYRMTWEFSATALYTLDMYKDPSGKFIIITNCNDYKIISEFFG